MSVDEETRRKIEELLGNIIEELIKEMKIYIEKLETAHHNRDVKTMYESASRLHELSYRATRTTLYYTHYNWERDLLRNRGCDGCD